MTPIMRCKFYKDSDTITDVIWYYCKPGAKVLGYWHRFGHPCWDAAEGGFNPPVGFQTKPYVIDWTSGNNKGLPPGIKVFGLKDQFQHGVNIWESIPSTGSINALCGNQPIFKATGGVLKGGEAKVISVLRWTATGGVLKGGVATLSYRGGHMIVDGTLSGGLVSKGGKAFLRGFNLWVAVGGIRKGSTTRGGVLKLGKATVGIVANGGVVKGGAATITP